uniref:Uncharacterized protein n=1 Tax=Oryza meridionalis TaxID=40149 RepID=A0A0E0C9H5_9ORYZ
MFLEVQDAGEIQFLLHVLGYESAGVALSLVLLPLHQRSRLAESCKHLFHYSRIALSRRKSGAGCAPAWDSLARPESILASRCMYVI